MDSQAQAIEQMSRCFTAQRQANAEAAPPGVAERRDRLERLSDALYRARLEFVAALDADFGARAEQETLLADLWPALRACQHSHRHLARWMRPRARPIDLMLQRGRGWVEPQPLGVAGIVAPWNFPVFLSVAPLAAALAAGNRAMIKPSEHTPRTSGLLADILSRAFAPEEVAVITGDATVAQAFVALPFDHLLFTGSTAVGRQVMASAAANLTPVTLELGGKSPALVAADADIDAAASSIAFGKLVNAGQACVAPDYALVPNDRIAAFAAAYGSAARRLYPVWVGNADYTAIVSEHHRARLSKMLDEAAARGARIVPLHEAAGRMFDEAGRMQPTLVLGAAADCALLADEIFGPVLPVVGYDGLDQALAFINDRPRPLALYLFSNDRAVARAVIDRTVSGGVTINDTIVQTAADDLPFGGVGASGMGHYHGRDGFDTFSKLKPVFRRGRPNLLTLFQPPATRYSRKASGLLLRLARLKSRSSRR